MGNVTGIRETLKQLVCCKRDSGISCSSKESYLVTAEKSVSLAFLPLYCLSLLILIGASDNQLVEFINSKLDA